MATDTTVETTAQKEPVVKAATTKATAKAAAKEEIGQFVYVGPTKRGTKLSEGRTLVGTKSDVLDYLANEIVQWPAVERLLVPVSGLAKARTQLSTGDNLLSQYYADMQSAGKEE